MDVCLRVLKESNKSRFDSYSVRNIALIISHITFRDCRVHFFPTTFLEVALFGKPPLRKRPTTGLPQFIAVPCPLRKDPFVRILPGQPLGTTLKPILDPIINIFSAAKNKRGIK